MRKEKDLFEYQGKRRDQVEYSSNILVILVALFLGFILIVKMSSFFTAAF